MSETVVVLEPVTEVVTLTETEVVVSTSDATELVEVGLPGPQGIQGGEGPLAVSKNGTLVGSRMALNLIEGDNTTLVVADDGTEIDVTVNSTGGGGGVTAHSALTGLTSGDDHTQYQKESEKGAVSGYASLDAGGTVPDAQIPAAIARDAEVTSAIGTHTALGDAHHTAAHAVNGANHTGTLDDAQIPSGITRDTELVAHADDSTLIHGITDTGVLATDAEVATAVSDHAAAANPHPTYETSAEGQAKVDAHDADTSVHGIADTTALATDAELAAHEADTTSIHGIANTANLETSAGAQAKVDVHTSDAADAHDASAVSVVPFGTIAATDVQAALEEVAAEAGGGGAPTDADYLVGSTQGGLSAEIVVGATPGGELGGTWASPTVDASHSGSTHAATQAAAESTAAAALTGHTGDTSDAHDASAVSVVPAGGIASTDVQGALEELDTEKSASAHTHTHAATTGQTADQHHTESHALNAATHTGDLDDSQLSANVPLKDAENAFSEHNAFGDAATVNQDILAVDGVTLFPTLTVFNAYEVLTAISPAIKLGFRGDFTFNPASTAPGSLFWAADFVARILNGNTQAVGLLAGLDGFAIHGGTGVLGTGYGAKAVIESISTGTITTATGLLASVLNDSTGTITTSRGVYSKTGNANAGGTITTNHVGLFESTNAGTIVTDYGLYLNVGNTGTITTHYGLRIASPAGTITNNYGLYLNDHSATGSSNSYNLYSVGATAKNLFEGIVQADGALIIPRATSPAQTAEASLVWDSDDDRLTIGDGTARKSLMNQGDTAGGELAGTYPNPTVASTHSGSAHHTESHQSRHQAAGADAQAGNLDAVARTDVRKNSTGSVFSRRRLNLIEGTNVTLTVADDSGNEEVDVTIAAGGGGAPTDADYLVGTANGSLSAEIVVGTSPGGELGGTWAAPTVDATHAGSTHDPRRLFKVGNYYPGGAYGDSGVAMTLDELHLIPFECGETQSFDQIICSVTAGGTAGAVVRMGVFITDSDGRPSTLVSGSEGTIDSTGTGYKAYTFASPISPAAGLLWLGMVPQVATCSLRASNIGLGEPRWISSTGTYDLRAIAYVDTAISGALPSPPVIAGTETQAPICFLRAS